MSARYRVFCNYIRKLDGKEIEVSMSFHTEEDARLEIAGWKENPQCNRVCVVDTQAPPKGFVILEEKRLHAGSPIWA